VPSSDSTTDARTLISSFRKKIDAEIEIFLDEACSYIEGIGPELQPVAEAMRHFLTDGGKRFRPVLGAIGTMAVNGDAPDAAAIRAVAALEFLHACALIHDDVMDGSDTRRGNPSIHRRFEELHQSSSLAGDSARYGEASAILLGDLALIWADLLLHRSGLSADRLMAVLPIYDELRVELMAGQYLDVHEQSLASSDAARSLKVANFKSGKYSIERPLHFGAKLSFGSEETLAALTRYGIPIGEAFQLRDDILGVFGDPTETGKPAGDDLREGKRTVLIALAAERSGGDPSLANIGDPQIEPATIARVREIIISSGALDQVEEMISDRARAGEEALSSDAIAEEAKPLLRAMAQMALVRNH
jgi:geranylgeranyl diphosphate synthase type I